MRSVAEHEAKRGSVAKHRLEVEQRSGRGTQGYGSHAQRGCDHGKRSEAGEVEGGAPTKVLAGELRNEKGQSHTEGKRGGVERDAPRHVARLETVGQSFEARHVSARKADAGQTPDEDGRHNSFGKQRKGQSG